MRKLIRFGTVLFVLVAVIVAALMFWIDRIAEVAVEQGSTHALGVPTQLETADVRIVGRHFAMSGLRVSNPHGFKTPHFMTLEQGDVALAARSLLSEVIELPTLTLSGIDMHLEKRDGTSNYKVILENLKRFESQAETKSKGAKKFVVRKVLIKDIRVHVDLVGVGKLTRLDLPIDTIELNDVGSGGKPVHLSDLTNIVLKAVLSAVVQKGGRLIPGEIVQELSKALGELSSLADIAKIGELADFGVKTVETVADVVKEIGDALGRVTDIFSGDKKK